MSINSQSTSILHRSAVCRLRSAVCFRRAAVYGLLSGLLLFLAAGCSKPPAPAQDEPSVRGPKPAAPADIANLDEEALIAHINTITDPAALLTLKTKLSTSRQNTSAVLQVLAARQQELGGSRTCKPTTSVKPASPLIPLTKDQFVRMTEADLITRIHATDNLLDLLKLKDLLADKPKASPAVMKAVAGAEDALTSSLPGKIAREEDVFYLTTLQNALSSSTQGGPGILTQISKRREALLADQKTWKINEFLELKAFGYRYEAGNDYKIMMLVHVSQELPQDVRDLRFFILSKSEEMHYNELVNAHLKGYSPKTGSFQWSTRNLPRSLWVEDTDVVVEVKAQALELPLYLALLVDVNHRVAQHDRYKKQLGWWVFERNGD